MFTKKNFSLFLVSLVGFIDLMGMGLVYPMFSSMLFQGDCLILPEGTSDALRGTCLGILLATMPITQFFSAPMLGMLSDQKGRKKILVPSLVVGVGGYLIAMLAVNLDSFILLLVSRVAVGISAGTVAVVGAALADVSTPDEKAKNFGILNMACGLGFTVGPFLGGILSGYQIWPFVGYSLPFAVAGAVTLINLVLIMFFFEETYSGKTESHLSFIQGVLNIRKAFKIEGLQAIFLAVFLACVGWSFYWEFAPVTWITQHGFDTATIGNFYAYGAAIYAISCGLLIQPVVSRFSNQHILCYSLIGGGLSIGMLLLHTSPEWLWFYIPLQQFTIALFWPTASAVVSNSANEEMQGEILGVLQSVDSLAFAVSPLIAGPLLGISSSTPVVIGSLAMFFAALVLGNYLRNSPKSQKKGTADIR